MGAQYISKCQRAYDILGDVEDDGTYIKRLNYQKNGGALRKYFSEKVEDIYDFTIRERVKVVQDRLQRGAIYVTQSKNIKKINNTSILVHISKAWGTTLGVHQYNRTCLIFCSSFEAGYITTYILLEIRNFSFRATPMFECGEKNKVPNLFEDYEEDSHAQETVSC